MRLLAFEEKRFVPERTRSCFPVDSLCSDRIELSIIVFPLYNCIDRFLSNERKTSVGFFLISSQDMRSRSGFWQWHCADFRFQISDFSPKAEINEEIWALSKTRIRWVEVGICICTDSRFAITEAEKNVQIKITKSS